MMVPDYALIGEIMFFAYGFAQAKECGAKMVTTFKLCSEQLSAQVTALFCLRHRRSLFSTVTALWLEETGGCIIAGSFGVVVLTEGLSK